VVTIVRYMTEIWVVMVPPKECLAMDRAAGVLLDRVKGRNEVCMAY
jgi:hypothetical protein